MAINSGSNTVTQKIYLGLKSISGTQYDNMFNSDGTINHDGLAEDEYIDIGFVDSEREELSLGGIALSLPSTSAGSRIFWAIGGKILRITLSGIIPDGEYVGVGGTYTGKSNVSVFRYKMTKLLGYQTFDLSSNLLPHIVQFRRRYITETSGLSNDIDILGASGTYILGATGTDLLRAIVSGYSIDFIQGTRNVRYTISLDISNNNGPNLKTGIAPRAFGDI